MAYRVTGNFRLCYSATLSANFQLLTSSGGIDTIQYSVYSTSGIANFVTVTSSNGNLCVNDGLSEFKILAINTTAEAAGGFTQAQTRRTATVKMNVE